MKFALLTTSLLTMAAVLSAGPINQGPPAGSILDLGGTAIPASGTVQQYTINFTATLANTTLTFAIREDPGFISLENTTLLDVTTGNTPVASYLNGDFSGGTYTSNGNASTPVDWVFSNVFGASFSGVVDGSANCATGAANCWYDGSVQAYDEISQTFATVVGQTYHLSFFVGDNGGLTTFSDLSTNGDTVDTGGNGDDVLVYAQGTIPNLNAPEPATYGLVGLGLVGVGVIRARRSRKA
jgi:hypothetical protein